jgi:hypothetical protein
MWSLVIASSSAILMCRRVKLRALNRYVHVRTYLWRLHIYKDEILIEVEGIDYGIECQKAERLENTQNIDYKLAHNS